MVSLDTATDNNTSTELQRVQLTETVTTIDSLLRCIYPVPFVKINMVQIDELKSVIEAAHKYAMKSVETILEEFILSTPSLISCYSLRLYTIGKIYGFKKLIKETLPHVLRLDIARLPSFHMNFPEVDFLSFRDYHQLQHNKIRRAEEAIRIIQNISGGDLRCRCQLTHVGPQNLLQTRQCCFWESFKSSTILALAKNPTSDVLSETYRIGVVMTIRCEDRWKNSFECRSLLERPRMLIDNLSWEYAT